MAKRSKASAQSSSTASSTSSSQLPELLTIVLVEPPEATPGYLHFQQVEQEGDTCIPIFLSPEALHESWILDEAPGLIPYQVAPNLLATLLPGDELLVLNLGLEDERQLRMAELHGGGANAAAGAGADALDAAPEAGTGESDEMTDELGARAPGAAATKRRAQARPRPAASPAKGKPKAKAKASSAGKKKKRA